VGEESGGGDDRDRGVAKIIMNFRLVYYGPRREDDRKGGGLMPLQRLGGWSQDKAD